MNKTTYDFGYGPVPAHRHRNPDGTEGGWVSNAAVIGRCVDVSRTASVDREALIGDFVSIGAFASIGRSASIGQYSSIGPGASIGHYSSIGYRVSIGQNTSIKHRVSIGTTCRMCAYTKWATSPPQIQMPDEWLYVCAPGRIRSGCVELSFVEATEERIVEECEKAGYSEEVAHQYVLASAWLIDGCQSGALYQGEWIEEPK